MKILEIEEYIHIIQFWWQNHKLNQLHLCYYFHILNVLYMMKNKWVQLQMLHHNVWIQFIIQNLEIIFNGFSLDLINK